METLREAFLGCALACEGEISTCSLYKLIQMIMLLFSVLYARQKDLSNSGTSLRFRPESAGEHIDGGVFLASKLSFCARVPGVKHIAHSFQRPSTVFDQCLGKSSNQPANRFFAGPWRDLEKVSVKSHSWDAIVLKMLSSFTIT